MIKMDGYNCYYNVQFNRDINGVRRGTTKQIMIIPMQGKIFQPGRNEIGQHIDLIGTEDHRVMVMGGFDPELQKADNFYWVATDMAEVMEAFKEVPMVKVA